ncbi:unnamed protein product [Sphagnum jensenii]|uniref:Uncharacterized protein n=1 Tax=Sphagnum jensenii TaxID=128206 RepID=A0ABP1A0X8_9BRYO
MAGKEVCEEVEVEAMEAMEASMEASMAGKEACSGGTGTDDKEAKQRIIFSAVTLSTTTAFTGDGASSVLWCTIVLVIAPATGSDTKATGDVGSE